MILKLFLSDFFTIQESPYVIASQKMYKKVRSRRREHVPEVRDEERRHGALRSKMK